MAKRSFKDSLKFSRKPKDMGEEMVNALEAETELMRREYRPLTESKNPGLKR